MYRLRLLAVLAFVVVVGASLARGQDGTEPFDKQGDQKNTQEKAKNNDNHRRHWWSPPHLFHKKHDNAAGTGQTSNSPFTKTGAGANTTAKNQPVKTPDNKIVAASTTPKTNSTGKIVAGARPTTTAAAGAQTAAKGTAGNMQIKKTTATAGKKPVRHGCTPEQAKKSGCEVDKASSPKATTKPS
jgi:hypothetical protein